MASLVIKKKKAIGLLKEKISEGNTILVRISNIQNQSDYLLMIDEHELWWNSTGELLKQIFDDERIANNFQFVGHVGIDEKSIIQKIQDFKNEVQNDLNKIQRVITDINNGVYVTVDKFDFTYDGIIKALKRNKIVAIILVIIVVFLGASKLIESYVKTAKNLKEINKGSNNKDTLSINKSDNITLPIKDSLSKSLNLETILLDSVKLPYLENLTILDKGLYMRYDYNDLDIGGVNIDTISINARARNGSGLNISKSSDVLEINILKEPYIEFEYKGQFYSIETTGQHYSFYCTLTENIKPTLKLKKYRELK